MEGKSPVFELHLKSMSVCTETNQKDPLMSMKQTGTFLLTSSPRKELWIFLSLTQHVLAAIDYFQGKNSV